MALPRQQQGHTHQHGECRPSLEGVQKQSGRGAGAWRPHVAALLRNTPFGGGLGSTHPPNALGTRKHHDDGPLPQSHNPAHNLGKRKDGRTACGVTVATILDDILRRQPQLLAGVSGHKAKVLGRISDCARQRCGYVLTRCGQCGNEEIAAACKCNDRSCPSCGAKKRAEWAARVSERHFAPRYFHVVFTLPHELNSLIIRNAEPLLDLLMRSSAATLLAFAQDSKHLGGIPFLMCVLHTWTQALRFHPHVHCLISSGALSPEGRWVESPYDNFLFPVMALAKYFRGSFLAGLQRLVDFGEVELPPEWCGDAGLRDLTIELSQKKWVVYCKPPYRGKDVVIKYFARYTNRCGISDHRILEWNETEVVIAKRFDSSEPEPDGATPGRAPIKVPAAEFFRRFVSHILPRGFHRVRYFGLSSPSATTKRAAALTALEASGIRTNSATKIATLERPPPACSVCGSANTHQLSIRRAPTRLFRTTSTLNQRKEDSS